MTAPLRAGEPIIVNVALGERSYDIVIGRGLLSSLGQRIAALRPGAKVAIVSDQTVAKYHLAVAVAAAENARLAIATIVVPPGESSKSFPVLDRVCDDIIAARIERGDLVVALGGGVIGDLAGFAATIVRRGLDYVQVPTSLLAQVDSSVGGKTAIDSRHGKNLIGAFHQPVLVIADSALLDTLPAREHAIATSCRAKALTVSRDERETGERALLNLGHTFGHAFEAAAGFSDRLLHGEAISLGMVLAFEFSARRGLLTAADSARVERHLAAVGLPTQLKQVSGSLPDVDRLMDLIAQDKKVKRGKLTFILARGIGTAFIAPNVDAAEVRAFLIEKFAARC